MIKIKRLTWIDRGRGLAMLLVMVGHLLVMGERRVPGLTLVLVWIYSIHVPLFFFISGYLKARPKKETQRKRQITTIIKSTRRLIMPYYLYGILALFWFHYVVAYALPRFAYYQNWDSHFLTATFLGWRDNPYSAHMGTLWFLLSLWLVESIFMGFKCLHDKAKRVSYMMIIILAIMVIIVWIGYPNLLLPFSIDTVPAGLLFFSFGYVYQRKEVLLQKWRNLWGILLLGFIHFCCAYGNFGLTGKRVDIFHHYYGHFFLFVISALTGVLALVFILQRSQIYKQHLLSFIGRHSLFFLITHQTYFLILLQMVLQHFILTK